MHVMPFDLKQTQHLFTQTDTGGVQQVIAKNPGNSQQIEVIRQHLLKISGEFSRGDFSNPEKIHGKEMPGLAALRAAKPRQLQVRTMNSLMALKFPIPRKIKRLLPPFTNGLMPNFSIMALMPCME
jgi:hypothetical protein